MGKLCVSEAMMRSSTPARRAARKHSCISAAKPLIITLRTPMRSAAARNGAPRAASGNRMSHAAIDETPSLRKPSQSACPASPNPMKATRITEPPSRRPAYPGVDVAALFRQASQEARIAEPDRVVAEIEHLLDRAVRIPLLFDDAIAGDRVSR